MTVSNFRNWNILSHSQQPMSIFARLDCCALVFQSTVRPLVDSSRVWKVRLDWQARYLTSVFIVDDAKIQIWCGYSPKTREWVCKFILDCETDFGGVDWLFGVALRRNCPSSTTISKAIKTCFTERTGRQRQTSSFKRTSSGTALMTWGKERLQTSRSDAHD